MPPDKSVGRKRALPEMVAVSDEAVQMGKRTVNNILEKRRKAARLLFKKGA